MSKFTENEVVGLSGVYWGWTIWFGTESGR
ncbi:protein of unknown function [Paraburkholderia dioscoreae]|uniref:Uncharacterized protein n=1 Tax=Paraburkholderia dioscoreae TaxID=2604047 RepID=A0A5Q4ZKA4_9BURK|nr:protein of unknown function [Paraburkholderia dioscoreae]